MESLVTTVEDLPGFKIQKSHFRIGSKIHITDFYYAKRFFQNGFFASRIAFLLARDIYDRIIETDRLNDVKTNGLTLVGYEMYSVLLLSLVDRFLRAKLHISGDKITHNLFEDAESLNLCKAFNVKRNAVIIVPIATTFSTAIKIEERLKQSWAQNGNSSKLYIFEPHFNVLYISNGPLSDDLGTIEDMFGWDKKRTGEKEIVVRAFFDETSVKKATRIQRFYLNVPTEWHNIEDCKLCAPVDADENELPLTERALYETDRTAVTPSIIFEPPRGRLFTEEERGRRYNFQGVAIAYGHHMRNNRHFLYAIDTEDFLEKNKIEVEKWLLGLENGEMKLGLRESDRVIIISTCHYSNAAFINLINERLFAGSANIIHYDPAYDYIQNFRMVYGRELNAANRIYFVDDALKSGSAFEKIYYFLDNTLIQTPNVSRGVSGCFFLVNMGQSFTYQSIKKRLVSQQGMYAFANLHLYTSLKHDEVSPLELEEARYLRLSETHSWIA
ncbi:hypothetical protein GWR56_13585 [Mucilaginibacter sp. 14171R-50]|uniref:hypothetical protein n=1 Tax=Mucilaginibacter sp. 14171R-50 TaxID=2703789 RepID=UPI00138D0B07|nr:hypothetical protein [Mucilaginibacter sp. 14171R-50]QHS56520.1 hypothetical protein GWR56_13585 [Mucilaginibacter sp. 14171R-50]